MSTEMHGLSVRCDQREFYNFNPPPDQQCGSYAQTFINQAGGYINNLNSTSACEYCPYSVGDQYYTPLNISFDHRWRDLGIFLGFVGFNVILVCRIRGEVFAVSLTFIHFLRPSSPPSFSALRNGDLIPMTSLSSVSFSFLQVQTARLTHKP